MRRSLVVAALLVLSMSWPRSAVAQRVTMRGGAFASLTGEALPYAVVHLDPGFSRRFTDEHGRFVFTDVLPGEYRLLVRQIGFRPLDTVITVTTVDVGVRVELQRIVVQLPSVTVTATTACDAPGRPDPVEQPDLARIFDQLEEHAARATLLADAYPHTARLERRIVERTAPGGERWWPTDTLVEPSADRWRYRPGEVVGWGVIQGRRARVVNLPMLAHLADTTFQASHCFAFAGLDTLAGDTVMRVAFEPATRIRRSDASGTAALDPVTYQLRQIAFALTRPQDLRDVASVHVVYDFVEIAADVPLVRQVRAITAFFPRGPASTIERVETQRLVAVHFERPIGRQ